MSNTFGKVFRLTTFGESHSNSMGGVIDGCPAGLTITKNHIQAALNRRRPNQSEITTSRNESDTIEILSGIYEQKTLGTPIGFIIRNNNQQPKDYDHLKNTFRPSHADITYHLKYKHRDHRGGGRSSARETASWVVGGAVAQKILDIHQIKVTAFVKSLHHLSLDTPIKNINLTSAHDNMMRCPDKDLAEKMIAYIKKIKEEGDTLGGEIACVISHVPSGLGEPVFNKLQADLAKAMFTINAVKGFEYGKGFAATKMKGSEHNDALFMDKNQVKSEKNHAGGILGGISNGENIYFNVAFKPIATIMKTQHTINVNYENVIVSGKGRHDVTALPRAVPIVEAMAKMVIADHLLLNRLIPVGV